MVITIARQYGSGGKEIGRMLADKLGIRFYDKELITLAAKESGISPEVFEQYDEKAANSLLYALSLGASASMGDYGLIPQLPMNDRLFLLQHEIIRQVSAEPCVIVGRCADYVLRDRADCIRLFIYADMEKRIRHVVDEHGVDEKKARSVIRKADKARANYYNYYADREWGDPENYHLCINSGELDTAGCAELIQAYLKLRGMV